MPKRSQGPQHGGKVTPTLPISLTLLTLAIGAPPLAAQSEAALREALEGRRVTLKIAMPGTEQGVDVYPAESRPLDYPRYADRLKDNGTAIRAGEVAMVTKIRVKSKHIEFQLDGGGYGTLGDETSSSVSVPATPKSRREQALEGEIRREQDPARKRQLQEELDELRLAREREDARNRAVVADAEAAREQAIRQRRLEGGSRFNVRYRDRVPASALTAEGLQAALAEYVSFDDPCLTADAIARETPAPAIPRKGMPIGEADERWGAPAATSQRNEGRLRVVTRSYVVPDGKIVADFVEGVLIRYTLASE